MAGERKIARRYTKSLFELSRQEGALEPVRNDMRLLRQLCADSRDLMNMLKSPIIKHDKKQAILENILYHKVNRLTLEAVKLIVRKQRESLLPIIAEEFYLLYNEFKRIQTARITTATELDESLREVVLALVKKYSDREEVDLEQRVDPELIGGFVLDIGDRQADSSLRYKLAKLKLQFIQHRN